MGDETRELARFMEALDYEQIPERVRQRALDILVDQIGNQIGCSELPWARQVYVVYRKTGGVSEATVTRYGDRLPLAAAVFINSTFGHSFEYDDANPLIHGHPGAELIPSLVATSERGHLTGREFLTSFVAAYEVRGRIGWAISPDTMERGGPQQSTTCGPFGVAAGVARLLGLKAEGIRDAMGIAGAFSGGLKQYDHGGGSVKRVYSAIAASGGLQAACLAQSGITGPEQILEGRRGLLRVYSTEFRPYRLTTGFLQTWTIERALFKPYCCCAIIHPAIDALKMLATQHGFAGPDVKSIEVSYPSGIADHASITSPKDLLGMQFSTAYTLALTLLKGRNTPHEYSEAALNDPEVGRLAARVAVREDPGLNRLSEEGHFPAHVRVVTRDGHKLESFVQDALGSSGAPISSAGLDEKFRSQVVPVLGAPRCEDLLGMLREVDQLEDMADLPPRFVV